MLQIVSQTVGNVVMEKSIKTAAGDIERGESISTALSKHPIFPSMIIRMITAGEQTGKIDNMLERISDFLDEEIETTLSGLTSLIEPILIVFLGVVVGGMVISSSTRSTFAMAITLTRTGTFEQAVCQRL